MHEHAVAHDDDHVALAQFLRPRLPRPKRSHACARLFGRLREDRCQLRRTEVDARRILEIGQATRRHIAKIAERVHVFVIAVEHVHGPTGGLRLVLHAGEQLEDLLLTITAIQLIAGLHDHQLAADPPIVLIGRARESQRAAGRFEVAVDVADRNEPRGRRKFFFDFGYLAGLDARAGFRGLVRRLARRRGSGTCWLGRGLWRLGLLVRRRWGEALARRQRREQYDPWKSDEQG